MRVATNMPTVGRERAVEVEPLLVADQLLDPRDLADPLDLDHDGPARTVAAEQVDRADVGRVLAPDDLQVLAQRLDPGRDQPLQLRLDAVLGQAGVVAELDGLVGSRPRAARS